MLNSIYVVFWLRPRISKNTETDKTRKPWTKKASTTESLISMLVVLCGLALVLVPEMAPRSQFARWVSENGIFAYLIWCFIGIVVIGVLLRWANSSKTSGD
jgi:protein-S-isoprenylcysteine O-methyltransferase Ste14